MAVQNGRGLAIPAFVVMCVWAFAGCAQGLGYVVMGSIDDRSTPPLVGPPGDPFGPDDWRFLLGLLLLLVWIASVNGMVGAAVLGSISLRRAAAGWGRVIAYLVTLGAGVALGMWWWTRDLSSDLPPTESRDEFIVGMGLILTTLATIAIARWLLQPAFRRTLVGPPPDPATLLYSDNTT